MTGFCIPFQADGFPPGFPSTGRLPCSWPALLRSAASLAGSTVGAGRTATAWLPGNVLEFAWRTALVGANLRQQRHRGPIQALRQTGQYRSLDPSEKGAVSFFLGQVSAKHFAEHLLAAPVFARVDAAMQAAGLPLTGRRPDFYGWGPTVGAFAVEAKGRSGIWNNHTMQQAKKQAQLLAPVLGGGGHAAVAHMAYFERREWKAWLMDPPPSRQGPGPSLESVLVAYYRPFERLLAERGAGQVEVLAGAEYDMAELPEVDVRLGLRRDLRAAFTQEGLADEGRGAKLKLALAGLGGAGEEGEAFAQVRSRLDRAARLAEEETAERRSAGTDGLLLQAGPSWEPELMLLEPDQRPSAGG